MNTVDEISWSKQNTRGQAGSAQPLASNGLLQRNFILIINPPQADGLRLAAAATSTREISVLDYPQLVFGRVQ
jgi:hypothetical protein